MNNKRVFLSDSQLKNGTVTATASGMADEEFHTEVIHPYGFASNPKEGGESVLFEINGDPNDYLALPSGGNVQAELGTTVIYHKNTKIVLHDKSLKISVGGNYFNIENGKVKTDMDIHTTGDVVAGKVSLKNHVHGGVDNGFGFTRSAK